MNHLTALIDNKPKNIRTHNLDQEIFWIDPVAQKFPKTGPKPFETSQKLAKNEPQTLLEDP